MRVQCGPDSTRVRSSTLMPDSGERDDVEGTAPSWPMANDESEAALRRDAPHTRLATVSATIVACSGRNSDR